MRQQSALHRRPWSYALTSNASLTKLPPPIDKRTKPPGPSFAGRGVVLRKSDDTGLQRSRDGRLAGLHDHIDFGANAEVCEIHARLNCKAGPRQQTTVVVGFIVIHIDAVAVN